MELPLQTPVDIYQIHRTPYFKRIHRNDSDQFERLKKAYESIRNFDEKPLQAQINKVRLEKLVQRINKSIPKTKLGPENRLNRPRPKSNDEIRCEKIVKSRQMGIEYSRQNFNSTTRLIKPKYVDPKEDLVKKKLKLNRRLDYGNKKSEINRSKIQRSQGFILSEAKEFGTFSSEAPTSEVREKLRKLLVHYIFENNPNSEVLNLFAEIAKTKNHLYWDLMGAMKKQQQYIKRYGKLTKFLSKFSMMNHNEKHYSSHEEVFQSKTNIRSCGSEILIKTYRYSDNDETLPLPSESFLKIPNDLPDDYVATKNESFTRDDSVDHFAEEMNEDNYLVEHFKITMENLTTNIERVVLERNANVCPKFGEIIRETVRKESALMLTNLENAMKN